MIRFVFFLLLALPFAGCDSNEPLIQSCDNESRDIEVEELVTGTSPTRVGAGDVVTLTYTGVLEDGTVFLDATRQIIGLATQTSGFQEGVFGMRIGSRRRITIPPYRGYSTFDYSSTVDGEAVDIPACSTLIYDVTVLDVGS